MVSAVLVAPAASAATSTASPRGVSLTSIVASGERYHFKVVLIASAVPLLVTRALSDTVVLMTTDGVVVSTATVKSGAGGAEAAVGISRGAEIFPVLPAVSCKTA